MGSIDRLARLGELRTENAAQAFMLRPGLLQVALLLLRDRAPEILTAKETALLHAVEQMLAAITGGPGETP
jgi:hypothetical protein